MKSSVRRFWVPAVALVLSMGACRNAASPESAAPTPAVQSKADASVAAATASKSVAEVSAPAGDGAGNAPEPEAATRKSAEPRLDPPGEEYLVWTDTGGIRTRWISSKGGDAKEIASVEGALLSDGDRLWLVAHSWETVKLQPCCALDEGGGQDPECKTNPGTVATVSMLGVRELGVGGAKAAARFVPIIGHDAERDELAYGEVYQATTALHGSVGTELYASHFLSGFGCGAHGYYSADFRGFDIAKGGPLDVDLKAAAARVPNAHRVVANKLREFMDPRPETAEGELERTQLTAFQYRGGPAGARVEYHFTIDVPWVGSDGAWNGYTRSEFAVGPATPEAGLPSDLPAPVAEAIKDSRGVFGYSQVHWKGAKRDAMRALLSDEAALSEWRGKSPEPPREDALKDQK